MQLTKNQSNIEFMSGIFVFCVFMFSLQYSTYLISGSLPDAIIKLSSFTLLMLFAFKLSNRMNGLEAVLLLIYFLLFASTAFPSLLYGFGVESVTKYLFMSLILPILIV